MTEELSAPSRRWLAVAAVAAGAFCQVTSEFLPVGVLTDIGTTLHVSDGVAGLMVTIPGATAAFVGPALLLSAGRVDRRKVLLVLALLLIVSNLIAAVAPSFAILLIGRLLLGCCVGGTWTFALAVVRRLVPPAAGDRATTIVLTSISAATVCGVPAGTLIATLFGWRAAFLASASISTLSLTAQALLLPPLPTTEAARLANLLAFLRVPAVRIGTLALGLTAAGHFAAFTYLKPLLQNVPEMQDAWVSAVLFAYGAAGIVGAYLGERAAARDTLRTYAGSALLLGAAMVALALVDKNVIPVAMIPVLWGGAFGAVPVVAQIWLFKSAPDLFESNSAMVNSTFQIMLAVGAALGGTVVDHVSVSAAMMLGGAFSILAAIVLRMAAAGDRKA